MIFTYFYSIPFFVEKIRILCKSAIIQQKQFPLLLHQMQTVCPIFFFEKLT